MEGEALLAYTGFQCYRYVNHVLAEKRRRETFHVCQLWGTIELEEVEMFSQTWYI
jgi:hypothetical protein